MRKQFVDDAEKSLYFKPFLKFPDAITPDDRERIASTARTVISEEIVPAYRKLLAFLEKEYVPACYDEVGAWRMTRGRRLLHGPGEALHDDQSHAGRNPRNRSRRSEAHSGRDGRHSA